MTRRPSWRHVAAVTCWALGACTPLQAQELISQPRSDFLLVDVHSVRDEVQLRAGPLQDPPYLYRGWTRTQRVELSPSGAFSLLRIWDRSLFQGGRREAETWEIELMPASPFALTVRSQGGQGHYDLSGMPLRNLAAFGFSGKLRFVFDRPQPQRLALAWLGVQDGELEVVHFLNARPRSAVISMSESAARIDLGGQSFAGEAEILFTGAEGAADLVVPRDVGLRVEGPPRVLQGFEAAHMQVTAGALQSRGFDASPCRLLLRFDAAVTDVRLRWTQVGAPAVAPEPAPADPLDRSFERQLTEFLVLTAKGEPEAAVRKLRGLQDLRPGDGRLLFLETWLRERPTPEFNVVPVLSEADERFRQGLDDYVAGRYEAALERFRAALAANPELRAAAAWIRRSAEELERSRRVEPPPQPPAEPEVIERVVVQTAPPLFALRFPQKPTTTLRASRVEISGQVADDVGIDRIEVQVNGEPLRDGAGNRVTLLPLSASTDSARSLPFAVVVPLRPGPNEILLTAYDRDATTHATQERLVVLRQPPFHRTGGFAVLLVALGLLAAATALVLRTRLRHQ